MKVSQIVCSIFLVLCFLFQNSCQTTTEMYSVKQASKNLKWLSKHIPNEEEVRKIEWSYIKTNLSGTLYRERKFNSHKKQITHLATHDNQFYDAHHGLYQEWWDNGKTKIKGYYSVGKKTGPWVAYDFNGNIISENYYTEDKVETKAVTDTASDDLESKILDPSYQYALFLSENSSNDLDWQSKLDKYMFANWSMPRNIDKSYGTIIVQFQIAVDGSVKNTIVQRGLNRDFEKICLELVNNMPKWKPAVKEGKPVESTQTLQIDIPQNSVWYNKISKNKRVPYVLIRS